MSNFYRCVPLVLVIMVATTGFGALPPINVTVSDTSGKVAFKGTTNANGGFATSKLKGATYVVQFTSTNPALKGNQYAIVVSAGKAKAAANAVAGERFAGAGVAVKITTGETTAEALRKHPGLNNPAAIRAMERSERETAASITGQITAEAKK